jgi:hypothetical protein
MQFFEFSEGSFRSNLANSYIVPCIQWFVESGDEGFLLPIASGSNWECALAVEGILEFLRSDATVTAHTRTHWFDVCDHTLRWLLSRRKLMNDGRDCT